MKRSAIGICAAALAMTATAGAQPNDAGQETVATDEPQHAEPLIMATGEVEPQPPPEHGWVAPPPERWRGGVAGGIAFGAMFVHDVDPGFYGRIEVGGYDIQTRRRGFIAGMLMGLEGWGAPAAGDHLDGGGSLPVIIYGGLQQDAFFTVLGAGFEALLLDRIDETTGFGLFAPEGAANVGVDLEGVRFLVDGRASYRWQFGAPDRSAFRLGLAIHLTTD